MDVNKIQFNSEYKTNQSVSVTGYCRVTSMHGKMNIMYGQEYSIVS
jgi:hypothetical protein